MTETANVGALWERATSASTNIAWECCPTLERRTLAEGCIAASCGGVGFGLSGELVSVRVIVGRDQDSRFPRSQFYGKTLILKCSRLYEYRTDSTHPWMKLGAQVISFTVPRRDFVSGLKVTLEVTPGC